jgi:hypothetical protein
MKDTLIRIVSGLLGLAAAVIAISYALNAIRFRDGAWYILPPLSLISAFASYVLLRRAFRDAKEGQS